MNPALKKFILKEIILSAVLIAIGIIIFIVSPSLFHPVFPFILVFFFIITTFTHNTLLVKAEKKPKAFPRTFLAITGIKMFLVFFILIILALIFREYILPIIIIFVINYFTFQVIEILAILKELKKIQ